MEKPLHKSTGIWGSALLMLFGIVQALQAGGPTPDAIESFLMGLTGFGIRRSIK